MLNQAAMKSAAENYPKHRNVQSSLNQSEPLSQAKLLFRQQRYLNDLVAFDRNSPINFFTRDANVFEHLGNIRVL